jgi:PAS domain S-box-containing protein
MSHSRPFDEDLYRTLANSSQAGVYILQDGKFQFANPHIQEYAGYAEEAMLGMDSISLIHPVDRMSARRNAVRMLKGQRFSPYEFRIITSDGRTKWILETVTSISYRGRRAVLGNSMNITEQKEARNRLEELEALESSILDAIPHAVIAAQPHLQFPNNPSSIFGWMSEEMNRRSVRLLSQRDIRRIVVFSPPPWRRTGQHRVPARRTRGLQHGPCPDRGTLAEAAIRELEDITMDPGRGSWRSGVLRKCSAQQDDRRWKGADARDSFNGQSGG